MLKRGFYGKEQETSQPLCVGIRRAAQNPKQGHGNADDVADIGYGRKNMPYKKLIKDK